MAEPRTRRGVRVPSGSRDWLLPLADPRARPLRSAGLRLAGISEVGRGFEWAGPAETHLLLATIAGTGTLEAGSARETLNSGDLLLSPARVSRCQATRAAHWKFLAIRLADDEQWRHLCARGVRRLPSHWLPRILAPVEGMLAEDPLGVALPIHTQTSRPGGEDPLEYLVSRYADRLGEPGDDGEPDVPRADAFELHATILRSQLVAMLREQPERDASELGDEGVALAGLWVRVRDRPRGPWDTEDLAAALGVSRATLFRMVKHRHGTTPAKLVQRVRMEEACRLLSEGHHPVQVIADQVGYASAFSFSAAFKRAVGMPPSMFRESAHSADPATAKTRGEPRATVDG